MTVEALGDTVAYDNGTGVKVAALGVVVLAGGSGGGGTSSEVEVTNFPETTAVTGPLTDTQLRATAVPVSGTVTATGPLTNAQLTAVTGTATTTTVTTDSASASATVLSLLRGILAELQTQTTVLNTIATNTTPAA